ncbi:hypothetical protein [Novipirellula artificiosorum]|uniref:YcxB-like protein domain-containing protein n=1 Tax=Novipirellula artificiosorum TaxID=2528016 RepID=A0A5C6E1I0_9BACT|nr:hypothetical protein [Novipirellula artificiosorum]TWU41847.1 hypothetical protein Poly41_01390 [Novipirellula artificiosorum]
MNPYEPSKALPTETAPVPFPDPGPIDVAFRVTRRDLRYAESQFVLKLHLLRLSLGSFAIILVSSGIVAGLAMMGHFVVGWIAAMILSATAYLALVHRSKMEIREQLVVHGLTPNARCNLRLRGDQLALATPTGIYRWPRKGVTVHRTFRGLLLCPEPRIYLFVSKRSDFQNETYRTFATRTTGTRSSPT